MSPISERHTYSAEPCPRCTVVAQISTACLNEGQMTYDDWKLRSDRDERPEEEPARCIHRFLTEEHCPACDGPEADDRIMAAAFGAQRIHPPEPPE